MGGQLRVASRLALALIATSGLVLPAFAQQLGVTPTPSHASRTLRFDWPALEIGSATYEEGPTGVTVFHFPGRVMATVDVRGAGVGHGFSVHGFQFHRQLQHLSGLCVRKEVNLSGNACHGAMCEINSRHGSPRRQLPCRLGHKRGRKLPHTCRNSVCAANAPAGIETVDSVHE